MAVGPLIVVMDRLLLRALERAPARRFGAGYGLLIAPAGAACIVHGVFEGFYRRGTANQRKFRPISLCLR